MYFWNKISENVGNNALSFDLRQENWSLCELFVPDLENIWKIDQNSLKNNLFLGSEIVFEEFCDNKLKSQIWFKKYLEWTFKWVKIYIFDNHNLAFYFIWKNFLETWKRMDLIHIDQHSDMRIPDFIPSKLSTLDEIEKYTFEWTNVGNYLVPLQKLWFVWQIFQKRTQDSVLQLTKDDVKNRILNVDLDFWAPEMLTNLDSLENVKKLIEHAEIVCIASSPYFLNQEIALDLIYKIFS